MLSVVELTKNYCFLSKMGFYSRCETVALCLFHYWKHLMLRYVIRQAGFAYAHTHNAGGYWLFILFLLCDCITVWPCDCMIVWLYDSMTMWLYDYMTVWQCVTIWLYDSMTVCDYMITWLYDSVWLCDFMTLTLYDCVDVLSSSVYQDEILIDRYGHMLVIAILNVMIK